MKLSAVLLLAAFPTATFSIRQGREKGRELYVRDKGNPFQKNDHLKDFRDYGSPTATPGAPTMKPTRMPTRVPTPKATPEPTPQTTEQPTRKPVEGTSEPTLPPPPTSSPTSSPTRAPVPDPTPVPTRAPVPDPTPSPTRAPVAGTPDPTPPPPPTSSPTSSPTRAPVPDPTPLPTRAPVPDPTPVPTRAPVPDATPVPTRAPVEDPTNEPTSAPVADPTPSPTEAPGGDPSPAPTTADFDICTDLGGSTIFELAGDESIDIAGDGFGSGDVFVFDFNTLTVRTSTGSSDGRCVLLEEQEELDDNYYCFINFNFDEGSILIQGVFFELIVVGGTGCFEGISGVVAVGSEGDFFTYQIDLLDEDSIPSDCAAFSNPWVETYDGIYVDWDNNGESPGDVFVFDSNPLITGDGSEGFVEGECMFLEELDQSKLFCTVTYWFDDSDNRLLAKGIFDEMIISGGTGCFHGASGTVSGSGLGDGTLQYTVTLDDSGSANDPSCTEDIFTNPLSEPWGDLFVDYNGIDDDTFGEGPGDIYVFDNKDVTIPLPSGETVEGSMAGRCFIMPSDEDFFCQYAVYLPDGAITFQGQFGTAMHITGGTGCFSGLAGYVVGDSDDDAEAFLYTFVV